MREFKSISSDLNEQVPTDWEVTKLNLVANLRRGPFGGALKVDSFVPEGYAVYEQQHAIHKKLSNIRYFINENKYKEMLTFKVEVNDILLSCSGTIGESVVIPTDYKEGIINQALLRIRLFRADLNINYFKYYMDSFLFQTLITDNSHGSAMKNIASMNVINKIPVPVPTKNEQEKIVLVLDSKLKVLDKTIEMKYKMLELLEKQRQSIITEAVTKGLNPNVKMKDSGVKWIGEIPNSWELSKIKYQANINSTVLAENTDPSFELKYIDIGSVNSKGEIINLELMKFEGAPSRARRIVKKYDVIVSTVRTYLKAIATIESDESNLICSTGFAVLTAKSSINARYLSYLFKSTKYVDEIVSRSIGVSYPAINASEIGQLECLLPPKEEQDKIVKYINQKIFAIDSVEKNVEKQIEKLKEYRQSLIYEAVTGKIDVREMELH